jgi:hypothetical protein
MQSDRSIMRARRIEWLRSNRRLWEGFPRFRSEVFRSIEFTRRWRDVIVQMKKLNLVSLNTYHGDINLMSMINEIRDGKHKKK